jgi:hypothetical protein
MLAKRPEKSLNQALLSERSAKMAATGRQPYETFEPTSYGVPSERLKVPADLSPAAKRAFLELVSSCPSEQFRVCDLPLVRRWAELSVMCQLAAANLETGGMIGPNGKPSPWVAIHLQATKALSGIALRLRVSPQSRAPRAPKSKARQLSYYDLENLQRQEADANGSQEEGEDDVQRAQ